MSERILFVTGRLAESAIRRVLAEINQTPTVDKSKPDAKSSSSSKSSLADDFDVHVLGISVAALMHVDWVSRKLEITESFDRVILPGWCQGDLGKLTAQFGVPFELGPKDLFDLPSYLRGQVRQPPDFSKYDIEILAEINHAPRMTDRQILEMANRFRDSGADVIDLGCIPGETWSRVSDVVRLLKAENHRVSIDSFERTEVEAAVAAGASLVLSCNQENVEWCSQLDAEVVAIPETPFEVERLESTIETLDKNNARFRVDPIIEPIGFGFAKSLQRYYETRRRWPDVEIMMGIGNVTELTEVDTAGVNFLLAAICQELKINSVLTTEVINWARSAVREFDVARRHVRYSVEEKSLPKHVDSSMLLLRDPAARELGEEVLVELASQLKDPNYRIFAERGELHVMNRDGYWRGTDPFELFARVRRDAANQLEEGHAFYLGYELCKAATALLLGKSYIQDQSLRWGFLQEQERDGNPNHS
jgi:dihydropteroate synthase-like protein